MPFKASFINDRFATKLFSKILIKTLAPLLDKFSNYSLKDSFQFIEKVILIPHSKVKSSYMIAYDIKSLFTDILVVKVIKICLKVLYHSGFKLPQMPEFVCKEILHMAVLGV